MMSYSTSAPPKGILSKGSVRMDRWQDVQCNRFFRLDSSAWCVIAMLADLADDCTRYVRKCDSDRPSGAGSIARPGVACHRVKYNVAFASFNRSSVATLASTAPMQFRGRTGWLRALPAPHQGGSRGVLGCISCFSAIIDRGICAGQCGNRDH